MAIERISGHKSAHQLAFAHYLRTGQRLTNAEWLTRAERKFNPYHDELGRFTSPPGVTVSWGRHAAGAQDVGGRDPAQGSRTAPRVGANSDAGQSRTAPNQAGRPRTAHTKPAAQPGFRSDFVRNAVSPETGNAETYFELNKRQAYLDRLRTEAGLHPDPIVKADLDEFQRRLNADRGRLDDISRRVLDPATTEILRAGFTPADVAAGTVNIATGKGEVDDYLAVASVVPIGRIAGRMGKLARAAWVANESADGIARRVIQLGGTYRDIRGLPGYEAHHMPGNKVSRLGKGDGPAIAMLKEDHRKLLTSTPGKEAETFRKLQSEHIARGDFAAALQMDIDHVRNVFGTKYDDAIEQMLRHSREKGLIR